MRRLALLLLPLLLLLTACAQEEFSGEEDTPWYSQVTTPEEEDSPSHRLSRFALAYHEDQTLDPITCEEGLQFPLASLLYDRLFELDSSFTPQAALCDSWSVSEDGLTWSLHLRENVLFSDGSTLTAADVVASIRRAMDSQRYGERLSGVLSAVAQGTDTVRLTLRTPNSALPALLDLPVTKSGTEDALVPVGTGPYLYITDGDEAYLTANSQWWRGSSQPLERIELVNAKDLDTARYLFTAQEIQLLCTDLTGDSATLTGSLDCADAPTTVMQFIGVNTAHPLLSEAAVRRALSAGIDRQEVVDGYLSGHGLGASLPLSPAAGLYPEDLESAYSYTAFYQALRDAGLSAGESQTLRLLVNEESAYKVSIAQYLAEKLSQYDLQVTVETLPWDAFLAALASGDFDLYYGEIKLTADWDISSLVGTGGSLNYGGWSSADTDALLASFRTSEDRQAACDALCAHLSQQMPLIPVCFKSVSVLTHSGTVEGLSPTAANAFYGLERWSVDIAPAEEAAEESAG